jgi:hypothetical protein
MMLDVYAKSITLVKRAAHSKIVGQITAGQSGLKRA